MSRVAKKALTRRQIILAVRRYARADVADSWSGGGDPNDVPYIERELTSAWDGMVNVVDRLLAERAELVAALNEAIASLDSEASSEYGGTTLLAGKLAEQDPLRAIAAKYEVKS